MNLCCRINNGFYYALWRPSQDESKQNMYLSIVLLRSKTAYNESLCSQFFTNKWRHLSDMSSYHLYVSIKQPISAFFFIVYSLWSIRLKCPCEFTKKIMNSTSLSLILILCFFSGKSTQIQYRTLFSNLLFI